MGRPIKDKYFGTIAGSGQTIRCSFKTSGTTYADGFIVRARGQRKFMVQSVAGGTATRAVCRLVSSIANNGDMTIKVFPYAASPPGSGAAASVSAFQAVSGAIVAGGSAYTVGDILTVVGGTNSLVTKFTVSSVDGSGAVTGITLTQAGTYSIAPSGTLSTTATLPGGYTGSGVGSSCTLTVSFGIKTFSVTPGSLYNAAPSVAITGGGGTGATALAGLSAGGVTLTLENPGSGFVGNVNTVTVTLTKVGGSTVEYARKITAHYVYTWTSNTYPNPAAADRYKWFVEPTSLVAGQVILETA